MTVRRTLPMAALAAALAIPCQAAEITTTRTIPASQTAEFGTPYSISVMPGGRVVRLSGSFSWAVPQTLSALLAQAPNVQTIWLDSPGGYLLPAIEVAKLIQVRRLETYVPRMCASACTIAFLGGTRRTVAPQGQLGFHQGHVPRMDPARVDPIMRTVYRSAGVQPDFIDHVLATPPQTIWIPNPRELREAGVTTDDPVADAPPAMRQPVTSGADVPSP